ncbi:MAG: flagellar export chaperone FlgN [Phycisphaerae bacterium]
MSDSLTQNQPPMPTTLNVATHVAADALRAYLDGLYGEMRELLEIADAKLKAIRAAAANDLHDLASQETEALARIMQKEQHRSAAITQLAQALHQPNLTNASLREVIAALPSEISAKLTGKTTGLVDISEKLKKRNDLVAQVARGVQEHIDDVFTQVARANVEPEGYGRNGRPNLQERRKWVDAVG